MVYPAVVISFAMVVMLALVAFIVPVFAKIFKDFGGELPGPDQVHGRHVGLRDRPLVLCASRSPAGSPGRFFAWKKSTWGRPQWDRFRLRVPLKIGDTVQKIALARWSRTFSALVSSGVPILQAIEITGQTAGNALVERGDGRRDRHRSSAAARSPPRSRTSRCSRRWWST